MNKLPQQAGVFARQQTNNIRRFPQSGIQDKRLTTAALYIDIKINPAKIKK
jgi:hypothetical protein